MPQTRAGSHGHGSVRNGRFVRVLLPCIVKRREAQESVCKKAAHLHSYDCLRKPIGRASTRAPTLGLATTPNRDYLLAFGGEKFPRKSAAPHTKTHSSPPRSFSITNGRNSDKQQGLTIIIAPLLCKGGPLIRNCFSLSVSLSAWLAPLQLNWQQRRASRESRQLERPPCCGELAWSLSQFREQSFRFL